MSMNHYRGGYSAAVERVKELRGYMADEARLGGAATLDDLLNFMDIVIEFMEVATRKEKPE